MRTIPTALTKEQQGDLLLVKGYHLKHPKNSHARFPTVSQYLAYLALS